MGSRGNIAIDSLEGERVYFHTHFSGYALIGILQDIIFDAKQTARAVDEGRFQWDDPIYLGHILYSRLAGQFESVSFLFENEYPVPVVDLQKRKIHFEECENEDTEYTFEEFLSLSPEKLRKIHGHSANKR